MPWAVNRTDRECLTRSGRLPYDARVAKRTSFYVIVSIALSFLLIGLLVSRIDAKELAETLTRIFLPALLAYMAIALLGAVLRAWRYKLFLSPRPIRWRDILMATFIRNSFVDLLPARLGSLSFIYVLNKRLDFAFEAATSAFVASFVYDFLTLSPFVVGGRLRRRIRGRRPSRPPRFSSWPGPSSPCGSSSCWKLILVLHIWPPVLRQDS